jgi:serine kinase of HPr protein (carbohydrate metabolism regulator)
MTRPEISAPDIHEPSVHATALLWGPKALLLRGPSGSGKSRLAWRLIAAAGQGRGFARLIGDDRVHLHQVAGQLLVRPSLTLAGQIEIRGLGILTVPFEPVALVGLVVDLAAADAERLPEPDFVTLEGVHLPRLAVAEGTDPLPLLDAWRDGQQSGNLCQDATSGLMDRP